MSKRHIAIIFLLISSVVNLASAQDDNTPTSTPSTNLIFQQSVAVYFPLAVQFNASLAARQEDITSGSLTLFQASGFEQIIDLTFEGDNNAIIGTSVDTTALSKTILFEEGETPRPFEPLAYRWHIETKGEVVSEFAEEVIFQPQGLAWQPIDQPPLTFWWYNEGLGMNVMRESLMNVYNLLQAQTDQAPQLNFVIYEADYRFCDVAVDPDTNAQKLVMFGNPSLPCSIEELRQFYTDNDLIFLQRQNNDFEVLENQLVGELVTRFYGRLWNADLVVPAWFMSGLTQLYRQVGDIRALATAQTALTQGRLLSIGQLDSPPPDDPAQLELWQAQSYLLLIYLADTFGADAPFTLARSLKDAEDFASAFDELTGTSPEQLYRVWRTWLESKGAEVAVLWNPYLATTPTPTPTVTNTPIPPTQTPTDTPTITLTPTSTSLIGRIPTEVVITATSGPPTAVPTVTNTPLPAGSFPTSTPLPTAKGDSDNGLPCAAPAAVAPVVGIVLAWKRKKKV